MYWLLLKQLANFSHGNFILNMEPHKYIKWQEINFYEILGIIIKGL